MRRDKICEFSALGPVSGCDDAIEHRDDKGFLVRRERCADCKLDKLDGAIAQDPVLHRAFDLDFALTAGIRLTLEEIDVEEFRALKILRVERSKYESEQMKKARTSGR